MAIALDRDLHVSPAAFAEAWSQDDEARRAGAAVVEPVGAGPLMVPGLLELVIVPLLVNLGSSGLYDLVKRLVVARSETPAVTTEEVEVTEVVTAGGDRVIVVRTRTQRPAA